MISIKNIKRSLENTKLMLSGDYGSILAKSGPLLPIGIYLVDHDGYFKYCNKYCRQILRIPESADISKRSILDYYVNPRQREELISKMDESEGILLNQIIKLKREDSTIIYVEDNCKRHPDGLPPGKYYFVGGFTDVTEIVRYQKLFDDLSAGIYRADVNNKLLMVNKAVAKIFGYETTQELIGFNVCNLWKYKKDFEKYFTRLHEKGELTNYKAEMLNKKNNTIYISINCKLMKNDSGKIIGREGTFTNVTAETKYLNALERFSNGYYEVKQENEKHIIVNCNEMFAKMHGYDSINEVIGQDISSFYFDTEQRMRFLEELEQAIKENRSEIKNYIMRARKKNRTPFWIQVDCGFERDPFGNVVGRQGVVVDINERMLIENQLREKQTELEETLKDMDKFVHQYIAPVMNIDSTAQTLMEFLEKRLFKTFHEIKNIDISEHHTTILIQHIEKFFACMNGKPTENKLFTILEQKKNQLVSREAEYSDPILRELWTREIIFQMLDIINQLIENFNTQPHSEPYFILKEIKNIIFDIYDICILKLHKRILDNAQITYKVIESLRRYLFTSRETPFDFSKTNILKIIKNNIELYYYTAKQKGLTIIPPEQNYILIEISENHIDRMFSNLILNAIKYSHQRSGGFIKIRVDDKRNDIDIKIENYGVPVTQDELEKVFEFGYRGKFSYDWNRTGSGIGLADAKKTVEKHNGQIHLSSKPAPNFAEPCDYDVPYLTTVTVTLPKRRETN